MELHEDPASDQAMEVTSESNLSMQSFSIISKLQTFTSGFQPGYYMMDLFEAFLIHSAYNPEDIQTIENVTRGQCSNSSWMELRKGMLTASDFQWISNRSTSRQNNHNTNVDAILRHIIERIPVESDMVAALDWGRKKENSARVLYKQVNQKLHIGFRVQR